jgi:hypothetical protein
MQPLKRVHGDDIRDRPPGGRARPGRRRSGKHRPSAVGGRVHANCSACRVARDASQARRKPGRRLTEDDIRALITALGNLRDVIRDAAPAEKAAIYDQLGLKITYLPGKDSPGPR